MVSLNKYVSIIAVIGAFQLSAYDLMPERFDGEFSDIDRGLEIYMKKDKAFAEEYINKFVKGGFDNISSKMRVVEYLKKLKLEIKPNEQMYQIGLRAYCNALENKYGKLQFDTNQYQRESFKMSRQLSHYDLFYAAYLFLKNSQNDDYRDRVWKLAILATDWFDPKKYNHTTGKVECRTRKCEVENPEYFRSSDGIYSTGLVINTIQTIYFLDTVKQNTGELFQDLTYLNVKTANDVVQLSIGLLLHHLYNLSADDKKVSDKKYKAIMLLTSRNFSEFMIHMEQEYPLSNVFQERKDKKIGFNK